MWLSVGKRRKYRVTFVPDIFWLIFYAFSVKDSVKVGNWNKITDSYGACSGHNGDTNRNVSCRSYKDALQKYLC